MSTIYKRAEGIVFTTVHLTKTVSDTIPFGSITSIQKKVLKGKTKIVLNLDAASWKDVPSKYVFDYDSVTIPVTSNATQLIALLNSYNTDFVWPKEFTATVGQTVFDTVDAADVNIIVLVQGVAWTRDADYTYDGTSVVTMKTPLAGGEVVQILKIK
jgi:hypothetical protein